MSFKLLAIRPLKDCHEDFLKNLEEGRIYKLYKEYEFYNESKRIDDYNFIIDRENILDVNKINFTPILPKNLYGEKINISAVVGKNGSGKSSLIELIYIAFYNLSIKGGLIKHIPVNHEKNLIHERQIAHLNIIIESLRQDLKKEIISDDELKDKERFLEYYSNLQTVDMQIKIPV
ncbi:MULTISPECIES: ATP-binding cassette domain-containing protein [unclassified Chryseobacterium]|uniref:ATP-binding cassette domain-containing protein n=1 Tax=unclassified Chryseobacterium TaxID=2593645 RepID=UPI00162AA065|nr:MULTISPECIES: ATP-binding cassette domain-containing protein [unclassified Chryseobacterium]